jgi:choline-glycine betaine transporter
MLKPEFPTFAWVSMLISAGMGTGLMFWSVAEPIYHFQDPPLIVGTIEPDTADAARQADGDHVLPLGSPRLGHLCFGGAFSRLLCL